jgi:hypothetical protein
LELQYDEPLYRIAFKFNLRYYNKVVCILNTCRIINNLLNVSAGNRPPGADDFLPVLIYVVGRCRLILS